MALIKILNTTDAFKKLSNEQNNIYIKKDNKYLKANQFKFMFGNSVVDGAENFNSTEFFEEISDDKILISKEGL